MNHELEQNAVDVVSQPLFQKLVATAMISMSLIADRMPDIITYATSFLGIMVAISIIRKNRAERKKFNLQSDLLEEKEKKRHEEVEDRKDHHLPLRREEDKK